MQLENSPDAKRLRANTPKQLLSYDEIVINDCMVPNAMYTPEVKGDCSVNKARELTNCEQSVPPPLSSLSSPHDQIVSPPPAPPLPPSSPPLLLSQLHNQGAFPTTQSEELSSDETYLSLDTSMASECLNSPARIHSAELCSSTLCTLCRTIDEVLSEVDQENVKHNGDMQQEQGKYSAKPCLSSLSSSGGACKNCNEDCGSAEEYLLPGHPIALRHMDKMFGLEEEVVELEKAVKCIHKWALSIPSFKSLSPDCQAKLLQSSWCELCVLKFAAMQTFQDQDETTFVFSSGCSYSKQQVADQKSKQVLCDVKHHVSYWIDQMNIDRTELSHLMTLLLFNPGTLKFKYLLVTGWHYCTEVSTKYINCSTKVPCSFSFKFYF